MAAGYGLQFLLATAYHGYFEGSPSGQTIGKKLMNVRVLDLHAGGPLGLNRGLIRGAVRYVSGLPCGLGFFCALWDPEKQTWHDKAANTVVVPTADYPVAAWPG